MSQSKTLPMTFCKLHSEFSNIPLLNHANFLAMSEPLVQFQEILPQNTNTSQKHNFMNAFVGGKKCKDALRLLTTKKQKDKEVIIKDNHEKQDFVWLCRYTINEQTTEKIFKMRPSNSSDRQSSTVTLSLDQPNRVLILNKELLVAIERKNVNLYQIDEGKLHLKSYDSLGLSNKLNCVEMSEVEYQGRRYLLIFGNEKILGKSYFKCLVYEIMVEQISLKYLKSSILAEKQIHKPAILFDSYEFYKKEKFCLIVGGYSDTTQTDYIYGALQVHLHLLLHEWLIYPIQQTRQIQFDGKHLINSGKSIKLSEQLTGKMVGSRWLIFSTEFQNVSELIFQYQNQLLPIKLKIRQENMKIQGENLLFLENNLYITPLDVKHASSNQLKFVWCDKDMNFKHRMLREIFQKFRL